ncbi:hypothetical protein Fot_23737 [Forsythia ovata]|uniref:Uncharacterized protein n=1 Tax=Forsythia ovata TaxID=205694 RepID=A0ABD1U492_9LAMI
MLLVDYSEKYDSMQSEWKTSSTNLENILGLLIVEKERKCNSNTMNEENKRHDIEGGRDLLGYISWLTWLASALRSAYTEGTPRHGKNSKTIKPHSNTISILIT